MERNIFDEVAEFYDRIFPEHIFNYYLQKRIKFIRSICAKTSLKILDVGCGTGTLIYYLSKYGYDVWGIDNSSKMVEIASQKLPGRIKKCDMLYIDFENESFDMVISIVSLHHLGDYRKVKRAISEMVRVTKKSGYILIWEHNPFNPYWYFLMKRVPQDTGKEKLIHSSFIVKNLKENGVKVRKIMKTGLVADFFPKWSLKFCDFMEEVIQKIFIFNFLFAHNVILGEKI